MIDAAIIHRTPDAALILGVVFGSPLTAQELRHEAAEAYGVPECQISLLIAAIDRPEPPRPDPAIVRRWCRDYYRAHTLRDVDEGDVERFCALHCRLRAAGVTLPAADVRYVEGLLRWQIAGAA